MDEKGMVKDPRPRPQMAGAPLFPGRNRSLAQLQPWKDLGTKRRDTQGLGDRQEGGFCPSSTISLGGRILFRVEMGAVTSKTFVDFLLKMMRHHPRRLVVVTGRAPPHVARPIKEFVRENEKRFALYYLPPILAGTQPHRAHLGLSQEEQAQGSYR